MVSEVVAASFGSSRQGISAQCDDGPDEYRKVDRGKNDQGITDPTPPYVPLSAAVGLRGHFRQSTTILPICSAFSIN